MESDRRMLAAGVLILSALAATHLAIWPRLGSGLMIAASAVAGAGIARRAASSLRDRHVSIELLVTLACGGALFIGEYWEAAAVTFLFELGAYLERRTLRTTRAALGQLLALAPERALVERGGETREIDPGEVAPGEIVVVKPGARVPVDGIVVSGSAAVNESMITGEPMPAEKRPGERVFAGTLSRSGLLRVETTSVGEDTTLARVVRRVEEAQEAKAPAQRLMERFARWYTPAIIGAAGLAFTWTGDTRLALTLLVIGCPGALVISIPVSIVAGIGRAARTGILIKGGEHLERAATVDVVAFDKTGTLTEGRLRLMEVRAATAAPAFSVATATALSPSVAGRRPHVAALAEARNWSPEQVRVIRLAAIAESASDHPLAEPVLEAAHALGEITPPDTLEDRPGRGIVAHRSGHEIVVGGDRLMRELEVQVPDAVERDVADLRGRGLTVAVVALDGWVAGVLGLADTLRPEAAPALRSLRHAGVRHIVLLTGDGEAGAAAVAAGIGIDEVHAGLLPDDKLACIRELQRFGAVVAMVGDGINDAPALAAADVSVAMGAAGTDTALETADVALMADDLMKLPEALRLSRATRRNLTQNVALALVTVAALLTGVFTGQIHMAGGMLVHEASVLAVIGNAMRLLRA